jgi:hypothetical protein
VKLNLVAVALTGRCWPNAVRREGQQSTDSVEKVGFSADLNAGTITIVEPTHHIEWFLGPSLTVAAWSLG